MGTEPTWYALSAQAQASQEAYDPDEDDVIDLGCPMCGCKQTEELTSEDPSGREQSITVCARCGYDG